MSNPANYNKFFMAELDKDQVIKEQAEKIATLESAVAEQGENIAELLIELATTREVNKALTDKIEQEPAKEKTADTFEIDGKTIGFAFSKMNHKGTVITPAEVLASEELQRELVEIKSGMLKH